MAMSISSPSLTYYENCTSSLATVLIAMSYIATKCFLLLPLSLLVLYLGYQRWQQQRSFATTSHSDIFTYHSVAVGQIFTLGVIFMLIGTFLDLVQVMRVGYNLCSIVLIGETSFTTLTCVEHYLAVVHPVIYLKSRQSGGIKIRNISCGCVWLLCFGWIGVEALHSTVFPFIPYFCFLTSSLVVVSFCSFSVLCVLIRPGPGETGRDKARVNQSKQRAFYTISAIMGVMWLCFLGYLVCFALAKSHVLNYTHECLVLMNGSWCSLPSSLVLPLLFLQRSGKMFCCRQ